MGRDTDTTIDDFLADLGYKPSTPEELFVKRFRDNTRNDIHALALSLKMSIRELNAFKRDGVRLTKNVLDNNVVTTRELTLNEIARHCIKHYCINCWSSQFVKVCHNPLLPLLDVNIVVDEFMSMDVIKRVISDSKLDQ